MDKLESFSIPTVHVNSEGWGPTTLPEQYVGVPFTPFGKADRLGKAADFIGREFGRYGRYRRDNYDNQEDDDDKFSLVDTSKTKSRGGGFRGRWQNRNRYQNRRREDLNKPQLKGKQAKYLMQHTRRGKQWKRSGNTRRYNNRNVKPKEASVKVEADWKVVEQFDLSALSKMSMTPPQAEDLKWCGQLYKYNEDYDRVSTRNEKKLERFDKVSFLSVTTVDDPVIQEYAKEVTQKGEGNTVFCTDELMAHLMTCSRSVFPWDLYFTRLDNDIVFIDKREDSGLDMLTVNETATSRNSQEDESKIASYNQPEKLSVEATAINQNFSQQILNKSKKKTYPNPNPLWDEEEEEDDMEPAAFAYRYRKWNLGNLNLIARTELHCRVPKKGNKAQLSTIYALNEWDSKLSGGVDWRSKIDSLRGAVLATELKNNACKLGRWTAQTLVAGADLMNIGYVSRQQSRDPYNHVILGTHFYKPREFAVQINLSRKNMWGTLKSIIDIILKQPVGKYVLMKDPNKPTLRVYSVPMSTFADDDDDDEEDDEEDGAEAGDEAAK
mmetsp:Transcript_17600/g.21322  ORF Transcript_17600/g.21322 Transcript_17600/m.21322 type:complete len:552 (-) Transcript_17600:1272-2927(-)